VLGVSARSLGFCSCWVEAQVGLLEPCRKSRALWKVKDQLVDSVLGCSPLLVLADQLGNH
jgi:hypothetical protein